MIRNYKRPFVQFVKKQSKAFRAIIEDEVALICENPDIGEAKVGDLAGIQVYKFKFNRQEYLIAYRQSANETMLILMIDFYKIGSHENFYSELKKYLQSEL